MKNSNSYKYNIVGIVIFAISFGMPVSAQVIINNNNSSVTNNISVESNSGGEVYVNGELVEEGESESTAEVSVYTEVNGKVIEDIQEEYRGTSTAVIEVKSEVEVDDDQIGVKTIIVNNDDKDVIERIVPIGKTTDVVNSDNADELDSLDKNEDKKESFRSDLFVEENSDIDFWQLLINFFKNIFSIF